MSDSMVKRLRELSSAVGVDDRKFRREFCMSIPPNEERDADLVLSNAADRIEALEARVQDLLEEVECDEQRVADLMRELAKVPDWISVEDRLPLPRQEVLVCNERIRIFSAVYVETGRFYDTTGIQLLKVTHWMPLPSPPTNEE